MGVERPLFCSPKGLEKHNDRERAARGDQEGGEKFIYFRHGQTLVKIIKREKQREPELEKKKKENGRRKECVIIIGALAQMNRALSLSSSKQITSMVPSI